MNQQRCAEVAAELDRILDSAIPGDDPGSLELVRLASRRLHDRIERLQHGELLERLVTDTEPRLSPEYDTRPDSAGLGAE
jgi:hypothetical protein